MGRHPIEVGRWASPKMRLDIVRELKMEAARLDANLYDVINRALWIGLQDIRRTKILSGEETARDDGVSKNLPLAGDRIDQRET